jgi:hypothetical protein
VKKDPGEDVMLTEVLIWAEKQRRMAGGEARAAAHRRRSVTRLMRACSGLLGSTGRRVGPCEANGAVSLAGAAPMAGNCHGGELTRDGVRAQFRRAQRRRPRSGGSESVLGTGRSSRGGSWWLQRTRAADARRGRKLCAAEQAVRGLGFGAAATGRG